MRTDAEFVHHLAIIERQCYYHAERLRSGTYTFLSAWRYSQMMNELTLASMTEKIMRTTGFKYDFKHLNIDTNVAAPSVAVTELLATTKKLFDASTPK